MCFLTHSVYLLRICLKCVQSVRGAGIPTNMTLISEQLQAVGYQVSDGLSGRWWVISSVVGYQFDLCMGLTDTKI